METQIDVVVIGAGAAGSAAALQLGRVRRSVVVVDAGKPRNAPAAHMQGYLGHDGRPPSEFSEIAHAELANYGIAITPGRVDSVVEVGDRLRCTVDNGDTYLTRRLVLASGLTDMLPDIDGVEPLWGGRVIHCPWCHGWEVRDRRIAVVDTSGMGAHQAHVFAQLSNDVTLIRNHQPALSDREIDDLRLGGVVAESRPAVSVIETPLGLEVGLADGDQLDVDVVVVGPRFEPNATMVEGLVNVVDHPSGMGRHVEADPMGATNHPKIFAAGNVADPMHQVLHAAAHGSKAAATLNAGLIDDDIAIGRQAEADRTEWDKRYDDHDGAMWSGEPNGTLVVACSAMTPGRALDIGCGEGADAIWLAERGWTVTATDISSVAIDRARKAAAARNVTVFFEVADVVSEPPPPESFDLVVLSYPALERTAGLAAIGSIIGSVAQDGQLLIIGHAHDTQSIQVAKDHGFDPDDYISIDDVRDALPATFTIEIDEQRERPNAPTDAHHHFDQVLRARTPAT